MDADEGYRIQENTEIPAHPSIERMTTSGESTLVSQQPPIYENFTKNQKTPVIPEFIR